MFKVSTSFKNTLTSNYPGKKGNRGETGIQGRKRIPNFRLRTTTQTPLAYTFNM